MDEENEVLDGDPGLYCVIPVPERSSDFSGSGGCIPPYSYQTVPPQISKVCLQQVALSILAIPVRPVLDPQGPYKDGGGICSQTQVTECLRVSSPGPHL